MSGMSSRDLLHRGRCRGQSGAAALEFAVLLPILVMITFGTCVFGLGAYYRSILSYAAREGVRWASVHGSTSLSVASAADVQTLVESRAPGLSPLTVTTTWTPATKVPGSVVRVDVSYNYSLDIPFVSSRTYVLSTSTEMTVVR